MTAFTLDDAREIARIAHKGQTDKLGVNYMRHVESVAAGLADFDLEIQIAGMLHDVVEDSSITIEDLREKGVSERSLRAIAAVSNNLHPELDYLAAIAEICKEPDATLVKISDNRHNMDPGRVRALEELTGEPANPKYEAARKLLWAAADPADVRKILARFGDTDVAP